MLLKFLNLIKSHQHDIFLAVCILSVAFISFNLGKISRNSGGEIKFEENAAIFKTVSGGGGVSGEMSPKISPKPLDLRVVASKKSSLKVYHYTWCSGAKQIKEENKIWFSSAQEAENGGYTIAGNCHK